MLYEKFGKRCCDVLLTIIGLPFFMVLFVFIAPIIYFSDRGSVFYNAPRLGKGGKIFKMYKFRSMKINAPDVRNEDGSTFNAENDPRLTKIGKFIRKTSIDETPQLLNILKGDMSFIGPRPDLPEAKNSYTDIEVRKLEIRPGITGYSQAYYRNSIVSKEKFKNDVYYVKHCSFVLDCKIIIKTMKSVLKNDSIFIKT